MHSPDVSTPPISRVLMTADGVGGVWPYALDLSRALSRHQIEVDLAVMGPSLSDAQRTEASRIPSLRLHEASFALEWMADPWDDVARAGEWLLELEARTAPDVVHINGYSHGAARVRAPVVIVAHSCVLSWWEAVHGEAAPYSWNVYADRVRAGIHAAASVVSPTRAMADSIVFTYGRPRDLRVIPNGRCAGSFRPAAAKEPFVFTAGRVWDDAKNVQTVCAAAPLIAWPVVVAGDDRGPDGVRRIPGAVRHVGKVEGEALCDLFSRAAIFALPARYEPFGLSPLEAALSGCALVLGDIRSLREVWGDAALFVPPDNRRALAAAINALSDNRFRSEMASRARTRAARFSDALMADAYAALYRELCSMPRAA